jgi:acyl-CoA thioester hydrolase
VKEVELSPDREERLRRIETGVHDQVEVVSRAVGEGAPTTVYDRRMALELGQVTDRKPPFKYSALTRVGFSETDAQGVVYYGRYLPYFDRARVEYHRHLGMLEAQPDGLEFVMRACTIDYLAPASFDDLLEVFVRPAQIGRTSVIYEYAAHRLDDDRLMVTAQQTVVLVDSAERRPTAVGDWFRRPVREFEGDSLLE